MWKLKDEETRAGFEAKFMVKLQLWEIGWGAIQESISEACREVCGMTTGRRGPEERETWWWNESVKNAIKAKNDAFKLWQRSRRDEDKKLYKLLSRIASREVARAKDDAWEQWSEGLDSACGRLKMFKIAKQMRKDRQDISGTNI